MHLNLDKKKTQWVYEKYRRTQSTKKTSGHANFGKCNHSVFKDNTRKSQNMFSKHRWSFNVGKIYMECRPYIAGALKRMVLPRFDLSTMIIDNRFPHWYYSLKVWRKFKQCLTMITDTDYSWFSKCRVCAHVCGNFFLATAQKWPFLTTKCRSLGAA